MVDTTRAMESSYVNADLVRESPTKKIVIIDEGSYEEGEYQGKKYEKFQMKVQMDGKMKTWSPNKDTVKNISAAFGRDSKLWIGKIIKLQLAKVSGKDSIIGVPVEEIRVTSENL